MRKIIASLITVSLFLGIGIAISPSFAEETKNYLRLYNQFLRNLEKQNDVPEVGGQAEETVDETTVLIQEEPTAPAVSEISMVGTIYRNESGNYFIRLEDKQRGDPDPRVYGTELSNEIVGAVVFDRVQLLGVPAYYNGVEIGISVTKLVVLTDKAPEPAVEDPTTEVVEDIPATQTFTGLIFIEDGRAYLLGEDATRLLLNSDLWRMAFENAWKGEVAVKGYLTPNGGIYYSDISR